MIILGIMIVIVSTDKCYSINSKEFKMSQYTPVTLDAFKHVNSDSNGNPRYAIHYTNFVLPEGVDVFNQYAEALYIAKKVWPHCKKFHNKSYGGGIVVSSYNLNDELKKLNEYNLKALS